MSEEQKPFLAKDVPPKSIADEKGVAEEARRLAINLECNKIATLPPEYWPNEWRKRLERLSVCGLALLRLMTNEKEAHELEKRAFAAINEVEKAYLDLEAANFPVTDVSLPEQDPGSMKDV